MVAVLRTRSPKLTIHPFARDLKNQPSGSPYAMLKESASRHVSSINLPTTPRGQSLWILCASTGIVWILCYFCGFIWLRGGVFWTLSSLKNATFLIELWWPGKLPEPSLIHLGSFWIISGVFEILSFFLIFDVIFTTFVTGLGSHWVLWVGGLYFLEL